MLDFRFGIEDWLEFDHPTRHLYICVVFLHQAVQKTPVMAGDDQISNLSGREMALVHHHQACAARLLSEGINAATTARPDQRLLRNIHMFLSSNVQQGAYTPWRSHLNGAHGLLALWGPKACLGEGDFVYFSLMMTNLFGTTTTPSHLIDCNVVSQHRFYLDIIDELKIDFMSSLTPVPRTLVKAVAEINLLRAAAHSGHSSTQSPRLAEILSSLNLFTFAGWVPDTTSQHDALFQISGTPVQGDTRSRSWEMLVDSFRQATDLYLIISMSDIHSDNTSCWFEIRNTAYHALRYAIDWMFEAKLTGGTHHKFITWPMVIAGVEAVYLGDNEHLQSLQSRLLGVSRDLGTLAMRDAAVFLADLWDKSRRQGPNSHLSWDKIFSRSPLFLM
ncbi:hypothetical protein F5X68DRAFT_246002 [Plectosphaerella plurivora]|uniref:Uncharacterized protein n=1 Tax=Plectosphaerella plurivora TaxID=936078 RepID=A0A9P9A5L7_9PEZI|nr:hypothetical protein F5X68DRAFT_246002 [Plectosphaerella plurivora]